MRFTLSIIALLLASCANKHQGPVEIITSFDATIYQPNGIQKRISAPLVRKKEVLLSSYGIYSWIIKIQYDYPDLHFVYVDPTNKVCRGELKSEPSSCTTKSNYTFLITPNHQ